MGTMPSTAREAIAPGTTAVAIIPPRIGHRALTDIESAMHALVSAVGRPVALELIGTAEARRFVVRATTTADLKQVIAQLRARYPQAVFCPLDPADDPLQLRPGETVSLIELRPGAANYLPLRAWKERELEHEGADPLLGQLAALAEVPDGMRAIAQLALVALPERWSQQQQRYALEHPLEPERQRERMQMAQSRTGNTSLAPVFLLFVLIGGLLLFQRFQSRMPLWVRQAITTLLQGKAPHLTALEIATLWHWGIGLIIGILVLLFGSVLLKRVFTRQTPLYDQQFVREKTARLAYRARLRLFVIGPCSSFPRAAETLLVPPHLRGRQASTYLGSYYQYQRERAWRRQRRHWRQWRAREHLVGWLSAVAVRRLRMRWSDWRAGWRERWEQWGDRRALTQARWERADALVGAYRQYHLATGGYFLPRRIWHARARALIGSPHWFRGWTAGVQRSSHYVSVADLAALWHLPQEEDLPDLGQIERTRARTRLVPAPLTHEGYQLGISTHAGRTLPVRFPPSALMRNLIAIAKSGKGKSTLLLALVQAAMADPLMGLFGLDPHGDLIDAILTLIPEARREEVVLIDLADEDRPVGINPLDVTVALGRDAVVSQLVAVCSKIWDGTWGPRMEAAFEMALKTLYEANQAIVAADPQEGPNKQYTLLDVGPVLTVHAFRMSLMKYVRDPVIRAWWSEQYAPKAPRDKLEMISPVLTKMNKFAASLVARRIVGQPRTTVDLAKEIRSGKIVLLRTAQGVVGTDVAAILGATILGMVGTALLAQQAVPVERRQRVRFIIDEFQTLPGVDWSKWLSELRKYGGSFALATQSLAHLDKLDPQLRPQVWANIEQIFAFGMAADDARIIERELDGIEIADLINLDDYEIYVKSSVGGQRQPVFSLRLEPPPQGDTTVAERIRQRCRARYGVRKEQVDGQIEQGLERHTITVYAAENSIFDATPSPTDPTEEHDQHSPPKQDAKEIGEGDGAKSPAKTPPTPPPKKHRRKPSGQATQRLQGVTPALVQQVPLLMDTPASASGADDGHAHAADAGGEP